eukprot:m51a1_g9684 putative tectonic family member 1 precursor (560) ;mRNA; r:1303357-1306067
MAHRSSTRTAAALSLFLALLCPAAAADNSSSSTSSTTNARELGKCVCDLTLNNCDPGCCCDADCDAATVQAFTACLAEGPAPTDVQYCSPRGDVVLSNRVNGSFLGGQLCVVFDNNPSQGRYYDSVSSVSSSELSSVSLAPSHAFAASSELPDPTADAAGYTQGSALLVGGTWGSAMSLPAPDYSGRCSDASRARFLVDESWSCLRSASDLQAACAGPLSHTHYVAELSVLSVPSQTGTRVSAVACASATACGSGVELRNTSYDAALGLCADAALSVAYTVGVTGRSVTSVKALVVLGNVTASSVVQTFSVSFVKAREGQDTSLIVARSGNPGYVVGKPLLFTTSAKDALATLRLPSSDAAGACSLDAGPVMAFGESAVSGCTLLLPRTTNGTPGLLGSPVLPAYVGAWGNASVSSTSDWTAVTVAAEPSADGACASGSVVTGVTYRAVYVRQGSEFNPQMRVVAFVVSYTSESVQKLMECGAECTSPRVVEFRAVAKYDEYPDGGLAREYVPKSPPGVPRLPDDILYPFKLGSAATARLLPLLVAASAAIGSGLPDAF